MYHPVLQAIAERVRMSCPLNERNIKQLIYTQYDHDAAQILVRWSLQKGYVQSCCGPSSVSYLVQSFVPLPKSSQPTHISSNVDVFNFELSAEDMAELDGLDSGKEGSVTWNPVDIP